MSCSVAGSSSFRQCDTPPMIDVVVRRLQRGDHGIDRLIESGLIAERAEQRQRHPGLVDQDGVGLVDQREGMAALHGLRGGELHVVAQMIEGEFTGDAVGDVTAIRRAPRVVVDVRGDDAAAQPEPIVDRPHPGGVAGGEIVVRGGDVDAVAGHRVERADQRGGQRLALAGPHLDDLAVMQRQRADQLRGNGMFVERAARRLADQREDLGLDGIGRRAGARPRPQVVRALAQRGVGEGAVVRLARQDPARRRVVAHQPAARREIQRAPRQTRNHFSSNRIGTVKANCAPPTSAGGVGSGWARCRSSSVSRTSAAEPLPFTILLDMMCP